ncbi:phage major capsid protein [Rhodovulum sp. MB263]|uniref:phage major capsid protein n=1 Tax=Rhodovulum sp. (strain MB263) TaxID=308754 RepID=UPI0009B720C7|nr:phage major capsid protein [Rhodovulum sp. MB263]ARC87134.1 capsid protein [Rhodovulum sp. MB263]
MAALKHPARGIIFARADAGAPAIFAELQKAFEEFKATHAEQIKGVSAKFDDVVTRDKLDKVNATVGDLQAALDAINAKLAAAQIGGGAAGGLRDPDYSEAFRAHFKTGAVQASLNKGTAAEGGYLAPVEWDRTITDKLVTVSPMRALATVMSIGTAGFTKLFNNRGTASGWVGETAARPETATASFGQMSYATGELYANPSATQQMLDDAEINLEAWLAGEVETEFAYQEGIAFVSGNGTNKPNGILTYVTGGANAAAHPWGAIATVDSGAAAALTADGIINLIYALPSAFTAGAGFAMNRNTQKLARLLKDGQGNYLWQPSYVAGQPATLAGYDLTEIAAMPDVAAGTKPILFGDFARTYLIIDRVGTRVLRDPFTNKPFVMFYTTKRVGGGLQNPETMKAMNIAA